MQFNSRRSDTDKGIGAFYYLCLLLSLEHVLLLTTSVLVDHVPPALF